MIRSTCLIQTNLTYPVNWSILIWTETGSSDVILQITKDKRITEPRMLIKILLKLQLYTNKPKLSSELEHLVWTEEGSSGVILQVKKEQRITELAC